MSIMDESYITGTVPLIYGKTGDRGIDGMGVRAVFLGLRPSGGEIGIHKAVDNGSAHTALRTRRIFDAGVIFRTVSVPHLIVDVYHIAGGIEVVGIEGQKKPTA